MATDILSDIFALGNIRCFSHTVTGSPHELGIKTWWETPASCHHHSRAYLQLGHGMAYPWRTCGLSHLQFSPKLVEISQNPLGTSHPSGELPLHPHFLFLSSKGDKQLCFGFEWLSSAPLSWAGWVLIGRLKIQGVPRAALRDGSGVSYIWLSDVNLRLQLWWSPDTWLGLSLKSGFQKIPKGENNDCIVKIKTTAFHPSSLSYVINVFWGLLTHSPHVRTSNYIFLHFLGISFCNYTFLLPYILLKCTRWLSATSYALL